MFQLPDFSPEYFIPRLLVLFIALPFHEFAHAWTANLFGDDTPRLNGRLTLNPLAHLDLLGSLLILFSFFGWAKPVPVNPYALQRRSPLALMWVSLAGPLSNFLLAILGAIPLRLVYLFPGLLNFPNSELVLRMDLVFVVINLSLMLFNLLPIAPLDGSKIAVAVLPESWGRVVEQISSFGPILLMFVVFVGPRLGVDLLGWIVDPALENLLHLLIGV